MEGFVDKGYGTWRDTSKEYPERVYGRVEVNEDDTPSFFHFFTGGAIEVAPGAALIFSPMGRPIALVPPHEVANIDFDS